MIPIILFKLTANRCSTQRRVTKPLMILLPVIGCLLACVSCQDQGAPIVDVSPLGDGLKVIGYAVVGAAVLGVLGKLVK
jgi:hypothetical protein